MVKRLALGLAVSCVALAQPALADDAYTVRTSDTRVKLALQAAGGSRPIITVFEGEMGTLEVAGRKIGFTAQVGGKPEYVRVQFFELTQINGHESIRAVGHARYTPGQAPAATVETVSGVVDALAVLAVLRPRVAPAATPTDAAAPRPDAPK